MIKKFFERIGWAKPEVVIPPLEKEALEYIYERFGVRKSLSIAQELTGSFHNLPRDSEVVNLANAGLLDIIAIASSYATTEAFAYLSTHVGTDSFMLAYCLTRLGSENNRGDYGELPESFADLIRNWKEYFTAGGSGNFLNRVREFSGNKQLLKYYHPDKSVLEADLLSKASRFLLDGGSLLSRELLAFALLSENAIAPEEFFRAFTYCQESAQKAREEFGSLSRFGIIRAVSEGRFEPTILGRCLVTQTLRDNHGKIMRGHWSSDTHPFSEVFARVKTGKLTLHPMFEQFAIDAGVTLKRQSVSKT